MRSIAIAIAAILAGFVIWGLSNDLADIKEVVKDNQLQLQRNQIQIQALSSELRAVESEKEEPLPKK